MYTTEIKNRKPSIGATGTADRRRSLTGYQQGRIQKKKNTRTARHCNSFLTDTIADIPPQSVICPCEAVELVTAGNYRYLLDSAANYADILGVSLEHKPGKSTGANIRNLYHDFTRILPPHHSLNIDSSNGRLMFVIYVGHEWNDSKLYWLPINFISGLGGKFRKIAVSFVRRFMESNGLSGFYALYDTDMTLEYLTEQEAEELDNSGLDQLIASYRQGPIRQLFAEIGNAKTSGLQDQLERYKPGNDREALLRQLLIEGLDFVGGCSIMHYNYDEQDDRNGEANPIELDRTVRVVYDLEDIVTENLIEYLNNEIEYTYCLSPKSWLTLSPATVHQLEPDDYPERLADWIDRFVQVICN